MQMLEDNKIGFMALPAHTSDRLKPLDVSVFGLFKNAANYFVDECTKRYSDCSLNFAMLSAQNVLSSIVYGYSAAMTSENIVSRFKNAGLFYLHASVVCSNGLRKSDRNDKRVSEDTSNDKIRYFMLSYKRHGPPNAVVKGGFVSSKAGIELTRADVRKVVAELESARHNESVRKDLEAALSHSKREVQLERKRKYFQKVQISKAWTRSRSHKIPFILQRMFKKKRDVTRMETLERRQDTQCKVDAATTTGNAHAAAGCDKRSG